MAQGATHEPRYKEARQTNHQSVKQTGLKCERVYSRKKEFLPESKSEDEAFSENSTDRSYKREKKKIELKGREWNSMNRVMERQRTSGKINSPENFLCYSYLPDGSEKNENKFNQKKKNISMSSFARSTENQDFKESLKSKSMIGKSSRKTDKNHDNMNDSSTRFPTNFQASERNDFTCSHHRQRNSSTLKICEKHKAQTEPKYLQPALSCLLEAEPPQGLNKSSQITVSEGVSTKNSTDATTVTTTLTNFSKSFREEELKNIISKCPICLKAMHQNCEGDKVDPTKSYDSKKEIITFNEFVPQFTLNEENTLKLNKAGSRIREKLVYVVEEEGKDSTKMETDLFSFNEILAIKKDLVELSNFAKKLKKLKESKRESDNEKDCNSQCRCNIATELLKNVNKRIEALEARQEELEKGSLSKEKIAISDCKSEKEWKNAEELIAQQKPSSKASSNIPTKQSVVLPVPSFSKTEMVVSRAEGFSNNSEIVNELIDIKTQLQKLEKKRMSKELSAEAVTANMSKPPKKKGHAIAVFSSKTYILAPDNTEKKKKESTDEKVKDSFNVFESQITKTYKNENTNQKIIKKAEKMKDTVANWLKSVTGLSESSSKHNEELVMSEICDQNRHENEKVSKSKKYDEILIKGDFQNQGVEGVKETEKEKSSSFNKDSGKLLKTSCGDFRWPLKSKTCYLTSSGRLFTLRQKPETVETMNLVLENENDFQPLDKVPPKVFSNVIRQSISSSSVPSVIVAKERIKRIIKREGKKDRGRNFGESRSKSMEVLSMNSNVSDQRKNLAKPLKKKYILEDKRSKESKNEMVKKEVEESMTSFKRKIENKSIPTNFSSNSELLGTVNLETNKWFENKSPDLKESLSNKVQLYSVTTLSGNDFRYCSPADKFMWMVRHAEQKDKETEKGKRNERNPEPKTQHATPKTPKSTKKENFVESKKGKKSSTSAKNQPKSKDLGNNEQNILKSVMHCQELHSPLHSEYSSNENCAEFNYKVKDTSRLKKFNWNEDHRSEGKSTNKVRSESEESGESFNKNKRGKKSKKYKANASETKTEEDSCIMGNFFKNLRGLYPKIGRFKDVPWLGYCDKECKKKKHLEKMRKEKEQQEKKLNKNDKFLRSQTEQNQSVYYHHFNPQKENNDEIRMEHLKKCKCVQVYMQSQNNQDWPGSKPLKPLLDKIPSQSGSESEGEIKTAEYYVGYSTEGGKKSKKKSSVHKHRDHEKTKQKKHPKERHHHQKKTKEEKPHKDKHLKKEKRVKTGKHHEKRAKSEEDVKKGKRKKKEKKNKCVCDKCGNVHRKKKPKKSKKRKEVHETTPSKTSETEEQPPPKEEQLKEEEHVVEEDHPEDEEEHHEDEKCQKPYLSFLKGFCSKPTKQSKSFLTAKFNELRYLKACPTIRKQKCVKKDKSVSSVSESQSFSNKDKQVDFEDTKSTDNTKTDNTTESEQMRDSDTNVSKKCYCKVKLEDIEGRLRSLEGQSKKKRKKSPSNESHGKKEKKRKHPRSSSSSSLQGKRKKKNSCLNCKKKNKKSKESSGVYFCTCLPFDSPFATNSMPKTNVINNNMRYCCDKTEENKTNKGTKLKGRLSSFQCMWKSFRKHVKKKGDGDFIENLDDASTDGILDDCSKSSPVPKKRAIFSIKSEPSNIFSKQKKKKPKKKDRGSKEKSKSKSKRHKSR